MSSADTSRELARRVFASEINDIEKTFKEDDDERAPNYALLPSGAHANRFFYVGTVTETEDVSDPDAEGEYWRARITDPTGTIAVYAGQYQPEAASVLRELNPPRYVAVVGKPRTWEPDDSDDVIVSLRPESITPLDAGGDKDHAEIVRDRWVQETAEQTLARLENEDGKYVEMAEDEYGDRSYLADVVVEALEELDAYDG